MTERPIEERHVFQLEGQMDRLDRLVVELLEEQTSRSNVQKWVKEGFITVNNKVEKANYKTLGDEVIKVNIPQEETLDVQAENIPLDIIYEDDDLLVINKPVGMVVHPSKGHPDGTLVNALMYHLGNNLSNAGDSVRPGIVHRIDKDTSGLLVVAKNNDAHQHLSKQLSNHTLGRIYIALVNQPLDNPSGMIEVPLARDKHNRLRYTPDRAGKEAITTFYLVNNYTDSALVQAELKTGRTHQIRVHMEFIGHPIVGDPIYRKGMPQMKGVLASMSGGQLLHAKELHFQHPRTGEFLTFESPIPQSFSDVIKTLVPINEG